MNHIPVLVREVLEFLAIKPEGIYIDATLGSGGHTEHILRKLGQKGRVIGFDRDEEAIKRTVKRLRDKRLIALHASFSEMKEHLQRAGFREVDGIMMDLGVSMEQLKDPERGFSFQSEGRLDMRMDRSQSLTAEEIVNTWGFQRLERIIREYGEERFARPIARAIINERRKGPIYSCKQLAEIVKRVKHKRERIHPATKTFQALRIAVNNELEELQEGLNQSVGLLKRGGRLVVLSYHSLEDRIVKRFFVKAEREGLMRRLNKKPVVPSEEEIRLNPSARSAKLRGGEKL
ncbi:MAG: 16S rRNA (cytosine(1402)-N(4))-methyltransferase RsmH [Nitrospirae bacterium]|nr:MAG: 16S rRNA (cytosine(1402)-N(4))-methyltransferase RsmH [Nitrospirota bacterium]